MTPSRLTVSLAACLLAGACATPLERSRNLADPAVPAVSLAQQVCSNCHGLTGTAVSPNFPNLAAQSEPYLVAQLTGFKSHSRQDPAGFEYMWGLSRALTDEQIAGLAAYYNAQKPGAQPLEGDQARLAAGQSIFEQGLTARNVPACATCHGPQGAGLAAFPRLAGQHADYVVKQLQVFQRSNDRPEGAVMKVVAHELTPQDIEDIAAYVQSLGNQ
jgi:cytochrome c553